MNGTSFRFRPLAGFTALCLPLFAILVALGVWQVERLHWKVALIEQIRRNMAAEPISLERARALGHRAQYRPVAVTGRFDYSGEAYVFTTGPDGAPVYHVLTPLILSGGGAVMVDRGYVPENLRLPETRPGSEPAGMHRVIGIWRIPDHPGSFTPQPDLRKRIWFARDLSKIARVDRLKLAVPALLEAVAAKHGRGWPRGGQTRIDIPNDHFEYALTWFLLAAALLAVYVEYHRAHGRLGFGPKSEGERGKA